MNVTYEIKNGQSLAAVLEALPKAVARGVALSFPAPFFRALGAVQ